MWQDLGVGVIQGASGSIAAAASVLQTGAGRVVAVPTKARTGQSFPDVATFLEQGVNAMAFQLQGFICLVGPKGMPEEMVQRLSSLMVEGGKSERVQKILTASYIEDSAINRDAFKKQYAEEGPVWIDLVRGLGLTPQ